MRELINRQLFADAMRSFVETAAGDQVWRRPLTLVERAMDARAVVMMGYERFEAEPLQALAQSEGMPAEAHAPYAQHYAQIDARAAFCSTRPLNEIIFNEHMGPLEEVNRLPIYREFFLPFDIGRFICVRLAPRGGAREGDANPYSLFAFSRENGAAAPDKREEAYVLIAAAAVQSALHAAAALNAARAAGAARSLALEALSFGVLFINESGRILDMNRAARRILSRGDGVREAGGRLRVEDPGARLRLEALLAGADRLHATSVIPARRTDSARPYTLMLMQPALSPALGESARSWPLFIVDSSAQSPAPEAIWARAFHLTPAECAIAKLMIAGLSQREMALARHVAFDTVRTQVRAIYGKLQVDKVNDAVACLLQLAALSGAAEEEGVAS